MQSELTPYITLVTTSGVLNTFLCLYVFFKRREFPEARLLVWWTALQSVYIFAFAFELASETLAEIKRWGVVEYVGIAFAPVVGLLLVLRYIDRRIPPALAYAMFAIPAVTMLLVATNDSHHLFYKDVYLRPDTPTPMADIIVGQWYIVHGAYTFGCLLAGVVLLLRQWLSTKNSFRVQLFTLICGQCLPMIGSFLYLIGVTPHGMDPVPFILSVTSALYIWAILSTRLLMIVPIAKENIFESMKEGVIVLDRAGRLIDYNRSATGMIPSLRRNLLGKKLGDIWENLTGLPFQGLRMKREEETIMELAWETGGKLSVYQARLSTVRGRGGDPIGDLLMLIDVTEQKRLEEQLTRMAYYDGLTGLCNRTQFMIRSKEQLDLAALRERPTSIVLFDIDHFKGFNDVYGHETGDKVLIHTANVCLGVLATDMLFARYGGEEFVVALRDVTIEQAGELAEQLRSALAATPFSSPAHGMLAVTASFGVATSEASGDSLETLLRLADAALYNAKRSGRNRVCLHEAAGAVR
ncbi:histidine kinase N-terminal 7TM domain-containing protein [Paenibacillus sp. LHD-117]|uniref:histidine kinase N-terminal 7TM domain-containing diguanylate cyclase n=1 Tax=Paenibacillus sp. LHD-117 TaxID=3071412 RepID=UPI0027DF0C95|nr:histidine kinase N-terminal 7TM domain-containing protein [Paenibacillus sp. LHD-117]MDQ6422667.1 histidine kinase N-terminal 7TM domain-containing protein [Paenibacillus sp. LHD-117]